jgi:hypothetical protein
MPFCPKCKAEFVAGKKWCPDCAVALVEEPVSEQSAPSGPPADAVELCVVANSTDLQLVENQLHAANIPTARQPRNIIVYVPEAQLEHARHVLTGESNETVFDTVGLSELTRLRLVCSACEKPTSVDLLEEMVPAKCTCGHYFDLADALPILDRYREVVRLMADKDFEIELELPKLGLEAEEEEGG